WLVDYINNRSDVGRETLTYSAERLGDITEFHVQNLRENIPKIANYLKDPLLATHIIKQSDQYSTAFKILSTEWVWQDDALNGEIQAIESTVTILTNNIDRMKNEVTKSSSWNDS